MCRRSKRREANLGTPYPISSRGRLSASRARVQSAVRRGMDLAEDGAVGRPVRRHLGPSRPRFETGAVSSIRHALPGFVLRH